jgi:hypothetical protein
MHFRRKDFHGGRSYASNPSDITQPSRASQAISWIKLQLSRLTRDDPTSAPLGLSRSYGEGFSLLGSDESQVRELDTKVFPIPRRERDARRAPWTGKEA